MINKYNLLRSIIWGIKIRWQRIVTDFLQILQYDALYELKKPETIYLMICCPVDIVTEGKDVKTAF